jgi:hypothetical protein
MKKIHVVPDGDQWSVKVEKQSQPLSTHKTQGDAIKAGKPIAQSSRTELVVHRPNGQIREAWSYGNDPFPPEG